LFRGLYRVRLRDGSLGVGELEGWWVGESEDIIVENKAEGLKISFLYLKKY